MNRIVTLFFCMLTGLSVFAGNGNDAKGHSIKVKLDNYEAKQLVLGFHYGNKQYVKDTVDLGSDGYFHFEADTLLPCGVYLLVLIPENNYIQVLVPENDQEFTIETDAKESVQYMKVNGSKDNEVFYDYLKFLAERRTLSESLKEEMKAASGNKADSTKIARKVLKIDDEVRDYQKKLMADHGNTLAAKIVNAAIEPVVPDFEGETEEIQRRKYYYYRDHYFDNIDLADGCLLRSPVLFGKVDNFINKVTPQHPDSISRAIDFVIDKMADAPDSYKYYLIHFLNYFAKSKIVGMDGVYVHIATKYYCKGKAPWANKEDLDKICDNASRLEPILIGKIAPNITVMNKKEETLSLWDVDADYTVLFFWDPDCSHCKKAAPFMVDFAKKYMDRGVRVFNVCTAVGEDAKECWENAEEKEFSDEFFINTYDPYLRSRFKTKYDIRTTPQIYILDRNHEILMKKIGAEQIEEVMEQVMQFHGKEKTND